MTEYSLLEGAAYFTAIHAELEHATKKAVTKSARLIRREARRVLGTYDYGWVSLQEATVAHKATGDSPLLETGELRRSIQFTVEGSRLNWTAYVGSNDPKALWHELGTRHIPPRSFLAGAAMRMEHEVHEICGHNLFHSLFSHHPDFEDDWSYDGED
jgi:phage gpG-like protein